MQYQYSAYTGFRCVACNIAFNSFDDQKQHYFAFHSRSIESTQNLARPSMPFKSKSKVKVSKGSIVDIKCEVCNISLSSTIAYDIHIKGKKHTKALQKLTLITKGNQQTNNKALTDVDLDAKVEPQTMFTANLICNDCSINCSNMEQLQKHLLGAKHLKVLKLKNYKEMMNQKDSSVYCENCDVYLMPEMMKMHRNGGKHKRKCNDNSSNEPVGKKRKVSAVLTTVEFCGYCALDLPSSQEAIAHYQSPKHAVNAVKVKNNAKFKCELCTIFFDNESLLTGHLKGFRHYVRANKGNANPEGEMSEKLLKMREKIRGLKGRKNAKQISQKSQETLAPENVTDTPLLDGESEKVEEKPSVTENKVDNV